LVHCEIECTREEILEGGVVRGQEVTPASPNVGETVSVCVAVIANRNVTGIAKLCTVDGIAIDCGLLLFLRQREFPRRNAVWIPEREEETPQVIVDREQVALVPILYVRLAPLLVRRCEASHGRGRRSDGGILQW
jgi:hypothetical protein